VELLEVGLVAARPVGRLLDVGGAQHVEDAIQAVLVDHVTNPDQVEVARGHTDHEVLLGDDPKDEVLRSSPLIVRISMSSMTAAPWFG
jgi:hypothetical protein